MRYERTRIIRHIPSACEVTFKAYRKRQSLSNCMTLNLLGLHHAWQALYSTTRSVQWATAKCVEQETKSTPVSTQTQVLLSPPLLLLLHVYLHYHLLLDQIMWEKGSTARSKCSSRYPDTSDSAFPGVSKDEKTGYYTPLWWFERCNSQQRDYQCKMRVCLWGSEHAVKRRIWCVGIGG